MTASQPHSLLDLPLEILVNILQHLTTPSFIQTTIACHKLFDVAVSSREVILHHLNQVPGIKLGLEDHTLDTTALFRILRQRASANLYGANFHADCRDLQFPNGTLDAAASCLADSTDYINISLVMKESLVVRHYGNRCSLKEHTPAYARGLGKVLQVVHWKSTISILYESMPCQVPPCTSCTESSVFHPTQSKDDDEDIADHVKDTASGSTYHLAHYNAYTNDRPDLFRIPLGPATPGKLSRALVPLHLTVHNRLKCAILWGDPTKTDSKKPLSELVVLYVSDRLPEPLEEASYDPILLLPLSPCSKSHGSDFTRNKTSEYLSQFKPRAIALADHGKSLMLYRGGTIIPYGILSARNSGRTVAQSSSYLRTANEVGIELSNFRIDNPFFGQHTFNATPAEVGSPGECLTVYLHLAITTPGVRVKGLRGPGPTDVYIVQARGTTDAEDCSHMIDLDDMGSIHYESPRVVARLWGWNPSLLANSTLTGLDSVCVSPKGTRIAIACWDRILVWPLHPDIFCEEWPREERRAFSLTEDSSDSGGAGDDLVVIVDDGNDNNTNTDVASSSGASSNGEGNASSSRSNTNKAMVKATKFYDLVKHPEFGEIVELKPIVLKLPGGAIARKMMWSSTNKEWLNEPAQDVDSDDVYSIVEDGHGDTASLPSSNSEPELLVATNEEQKRREVIEIPARTPPLNPDFISGSRLDPEDRQEIRSIGAELERLVKHAADNSTSALPTVAECDEDDRAGQELETAVAEIEGTQDAGNSDAPTIPIEQEPAIAKQVPEVNSEANEHATSLGGIGSAAPPSASTPPQAQAADTSLRLPPSPKFYADDSQMAASVALSSAPLHTANEIIEVKHLIPDRNDRNNAFYSHRPPSPPSRSPSTGPSRSRDASRVPSSISGDYCMFENENEGVKRLLRLKSRSKPIRRHKRNSEDDLVVLTDRGVQLWNLGPWARGRREKSWLDERLL